LAGVSTVMAIQSTARYAHDSGFYVSVAEDLCAAPTAELHQISLEMLRPMAAITTSAAWLAQ
ncbi:isochorismatase family protein, partial [Morganella morganii]